MEFRLLGPLEASRAGDPIPLGGPKQRTVLTHLLLRPNQVVPADRLIDEVWGETAPDAVRSSLQSYVSHLRKALGSDLLEGKRHGYVLHVNATEIDALRFEDLVKRARAIAESDAAAAVRLYSEALALWRGNALDDLAQQPSLRPEIARLETLRMAATEEKIAAELSLGRHAELLPELETLTARHPLSERLWGHLMVALYRCGRQGDALAVFLRARELLDSELGVDPSPQLQRLQEQILRHEPALEVVGTPLRGYRLLEILGHGAFGIVHRAFQPQINREVAVKAVHPQLANNAEFIRRFEVEAQTVARLEHPHIVPLYDYWREPDGAYLVMRLLRGGSLLDRLAHGPLDVATVVTVTEQVSQALAMAHRAGVVHSDVKPANILFDEDGNAYLSDFGIATDLAMHVTPRTPTGDTPLTPRSPEERRGEPATERSDIYSLGLVVRQMLGDDAPPAVGDVIARATAPRPEDRYANAGEVAAALRMALGMRHRPAALIGEVRNPYRGLHPFLEADAGDFFGRETLVARLLDRLDDDGPGSRFVTVVGPSGSGKSSVVRAGLVPALRKGAVAGSRSWFIVEMVPGHQPFAELQVAVQRVAARRLPLDVSDPLARGTRDSLATAAQWVLPDDGCELLLVVDQLEEVFTLVDEEHLRARFVECLVAAVTDPRSRVRVVATLRADFYDRPLHHPGLAELVDAGTQVVPPLTPDELERAIAGPADSVGVAVEPGLRAQIVADVAAEPGALPLLQYALTELFERRTTDTLELATYHEIGGVQVALARRAEEIFTSLPDDAQNATRQLFLRLVTPGDGVEDTRRRTPRAELLSLQHPADAMAAAIDAFGAARLLSFDRDPDSREPTVEVAHEALLREWQRVSDWIDGARQNVRTQRWLAAAAREWVDAERDESFLATGSRLEHLESWQRESGLSATPQEREFIAASQRQRDDRLAEERAREQHKRALQRRSYRRMQALVAVLTVASLLAGGLTVYAVRLGGNAQRQARVATARELAAAANANLDVDAERSLLLALEAVHRTRDEDGTVLPEAEEALHRALTASRAVMTVPGLGGLVDWSSDGRRFVTEGPEESGVIDIRDAGTGESLRSFVGHDIDVNDVKFSPDSTRVASTGDDGAMTVWDASTGEEITGVTTQGEVWGPAFSPDGRLVSAAWTDQGIMRVIDVATGRTVHEIGGLQLPFGTAFNPDGTQLAVTQFGGENEVVIFDARTGKRRGTLVGHAWAVMDVDWSPDGRWIATTGHDMTARVWDANTLKSRFALYGHTSPLIHADWSPDSSRLITGSEDGTARVWEISKDGAREVLSLSAHDTRGGLGGVAFSPDGDRVMTGNATMNAVRVWDVSSSGDAEWANLAGDPEIYSGVGFAPDGAVVASNGEGATMWDVDGRRRLQTFGPLAGPILAVDVSADGALVATASLDLTRVWDADDGSMAFQTGGGGFGGIDWNHDGTLLAVPRWEGTAVVDRSGDEVAKLREEPQFETTAARFSPDGRLLAMASFPAGRTEPAANRVKIWDWRRGEVVTTLPVAGYGMAFSPDGDRLVVADPGGVPGIWDVATGERVAALTGHSGQVFDVVYSPDGSLIASAGSDATVRLWHADTAEQALVLRGHVGGVSQVRFSPDGSRLVSGASDGVVRVWAVDLDDAMDLARKELTRSLTDDECRRFLHVASCADATRHR